MYTVYFLQSEKNNKTYVGYTGKDPKDRLAEHLSGTTAWTRNNGPFVLLYFETYSCKKDAIQRELFYKTGFGRKIRDAIITAVSARG